MLLEKYEGDPGGCHEFFLALECYFSEFLELTEGQRITTLVLRLTGLLLQWAAVVWRYGGSATENYSAFVEELMTVFGLPDPEPMQDHPVPRQRKLS